MRFSIRYKMLLLVTGVLVVAMLSYLLLASTLFQRDKRAFIFDLNASIAHTLSEEVASAVGSVSDKLLFYVAASKAQKDPRATLMKVFAGEPDLLQISLWSKQGTSFARDATLTDAPRLAAFNVTSDDLETAHKEHPIDFDAVLATGRFVANASVAPDVSLLWLAIKDDDRVIAALLRPERLLRIFGESGAYVAYLVDGRGQLVVHPDPERVIKHDNMRHLAGLDAALAEKSSRAVVQLRERDGQTVIGAYARIKDPPLLVVTETPESEAFNASRELIKKSALFAVGIVLAAMLVSIYFSRRLASPLKRLSEAMTDVGRGEFLVNVAVESRDEVGVLATAFNTMASELQDRDKRIEQARDQLIHSEKLAALGALSAEISHEIKNPLTSVLGFAQIAQKSTDLAEIKEHLATIEKQTKRVRELLDNTLRFTRVERNQNEPVNLNDVVGDTLKLVRHQLASQRIKVQSTLCDGALVLGNAGQLQQVVLNMVMNAQHAMRPNGGTLTLATEHGGNGSVCLKIADTGSGMDEATRAQLFKPFFTTKPKGEGTGLGLSVSQTIVEQHKGTIAVESAEGKGTTFTITLPRRS
ncbi:MAG: HAMP domain-containing protein [Deltaproteobacteria bacterium]|nr:HAMP domain-containing protein [Deltaproteobacteria bacterium]